MIILIGGTKGGSGKSTIATNLAACMACDGVNVMLMDADPQGTSAKWVERRVNREINPELLAKVNCMQTSGNVYNTAVDLSKLYEVVIIDAGGKDSRELRTAMLAADFLYVPLQASQFDMETLESLNEIVTVAKDNNPGLRSFGLLTRAPAQYGQTEVREAKNLLLEFPLFELANSVIGDRKAYRDVTPNGRGVVEYKNNKAKAEIQFLVQEIEHESAK